MKTIFRKKIMLKKSVIIPDDLLAAQKLVYEPNRFIIKNLVIEKESHEYGGSSFEMNEKTIKFRTAKITPTKTGQFVTFWKRIGCGPIMPYDMSDSFDLLIISVRDAKHFGQFIFPKSVLLHKGLLSHDGKGGKRAMRVYPPWDKATSQQAKETQDWQVAYFFEVEPKLDLLCAQKLLSCK
jgi:hypothetical protein